MSKMNFRKNNEEHNFWQNYTDLMAGLLIVFIIASLAAYGMYKKYIDPLKKASISWVNLNDTIINAELYKKFSDFQAAQDSIIRKYFSYNKQYHRFECTKEVLFPPEKATIPKENIEEMEEAGKEINSIIDDFRASTNLGFKVVIEGRAARSHTKTYYTPVQLDSIARFSYMRAYNLYNIWKDKGIISNIEDNGNEVFICGSGLGGIGRYEGYGSAGEDKNKTIIIQIIPILNL